MSCLWRRRDGGRGGRQDATILRTWGAAVLRPYKSLAAGGDGRSRYKIGGGCGGRGGTDSRRGDRADLGRSSAAPLQDQDHGSGAGSGGQRVQKVPLSQLMRLPLLVTKPLMMVPDQFVVSWWRESQEPVPVAFCSLVRVYVWPRRRIVQRCERLPLRYQVPSMRGRRQPPPPPLLLQRCQLVPLDQLICEPSGVSVPVTNCQPGADITFGPCRVPGDVSPCSLVRLKKTPPLLVIEACLFGSPCAHH